MKENSREENIKILEEMVEKSRDLREEDFYKLIGIKQIQAIATFIKVYKEIEEENETLNERNQYLVKYRAKLEKELYESNENYIPISLVEEKIEELKEKGESDLRTYGFAIETHLAKQVLQELLEKR